MLCDGRSITLVSNMTTMLLQLIKHCPITACPMMAVSLDTFVDHDDHIRKTGSLGYNNRKLGQNIFADSVYTSQSVLIMSFLQALPGNSVVQLSFSLFYQKSSFM